LFKFLLNNTLLKRALGCQTPTSSFPGGYAETLTPLPPPSLVVTLRRSLPYLIHPWWLRWDSKVIFSRS